MNDDKRGPMRLFLLLALGLAAATVTAARAAPVTPLVDGAWLEQRLGADGVVVLDVRNQLDGGSRATYEHAHIPGAIHTDYLKDGWRTEVDGVVGMLPPLRELERLIGGLGIRNSDHVVIVPAGVSALDYGSATRVYWTFKVLGHATVSILDGGHALWAKEGRPLESGAVTRPSSAFQIQFRPEYVASRDDVARATNGQLDAALIDNRPRQQFMGRAKHPKAARFGAIPTAVNVPQALFFDRESGRFTDPGRLAELWRDTGTDESVEQITYCNTGHWASLGWFTANELMGRRSRLYDGSMVDWAGRKELPMMHSP